MPVSMKYRTPLSAAAFALAAVAVPAAAPPAAHAGLGCCAGCGDAACLCPPPIAPSVGFVPGPPAFGPACAAPAPCGPRRMSGLPAYRPFGMPMLSELGECLGRGVGSLMDDVLLGPEVCGPGLPGCLADKFAAAHSCAAPCPAPCGPPALGPVGCAAPRLSISPFCPPDSGCAAPVCPLPVCPPVCAAPAEVCETTMVPRTETRYARRRCVTWKDVEQVCYRPQTSEYLEPVTRTECRTVDRGCYKMVWCPKLVTEEVCKTDYVRRVKVTQVPYTVTRKVAETSEQMVPYCHTTYVPKTVRRVFAPPTCAAPVFPVAPDCGAPADVLYGNSADAGYYGGDVTAGAVPGVEYADPQFGGNQLGGTQFGTPQPVNAYPPRSIDAPTLSSPTFAPLPTPGNATFGPTHDGTGIPPAPIPDDDFSQTPAWNPVPSNASASAAHGWVEETAPRKTW